MVHIIFDNDGEPVDGQTCKKKPKKVPFVDSRQQSQPSRGLANNSSSLSDQHGGFKKIQSVFDNNGEPTEDPVRGKKTIPLLQECEKEKKSRKHLPPTNSHLSSGQHKGIRQKYLHWENKPLISKHQGTKKDKSGKKKAPAFKEKSKHQGTKKKKYGKKKAPVFKEKQFKYEENEQMTRYNGVWILRSRVETLDRLKASLDEQQLDAKTVSYIAL